ncbi:MAG: PilZ domain-containing protein [Elusimicrobia bacterium]|nr:PilZ domain-containing protein [Elusimicrobiota bacterium]
MSNARNSNNARQFERYPTNFVLEIADYAKPEKKVTALITNISEGGLCFESDHKIEVGASLTLRLAVPMVVQGGVVRTETRQGKRRYGVRFHNVRFTPQERKFARPRTMVQKPTIKETLPEAA